jgi:5-aminopentanamidase
MNRAVKVACAQVAPIVGDAEGNRARAREAIHSAIAAGARLIVLPELCNSGYVFADAEEARGLAEPLDGPSVTEWRALTRAGGVVLVAGLCELADDGTLFNSAVVIDGGELLGVYRKTHLWDAEKLVFTPGAVSPPVIETAIGRVGVAICYDTCFPELLRGLALEGADVIAVPTNSPILTPPLEPLPIELMMASATAHVNHVCVAQADRTGHERGVDWVGASGIVDAVGRLLTAKADGETLLLAEVDLGAARDKRLGERNDALADRRPELYELNLRG